MEILREIYGRFAARSIQSLNRLHPCNRLFSSLSFAAAKMKLILGGYRYKIVFVGKAGPEVSLLVTVTAQYRMPASRKFRVDPAHLGNLPWSG
jgi:hypothetical protein